MDSCGSCHPIFVHTVKHVNQYVKLASIFFVELNLYCQRNILCTIFLPYQRFSNPVFRVLYEPLFSKLCVGYKSIALIDGTWPAREGGLTFAIMTDVQKFIFLSRLSASKPTASLWHISPHPLQHFGIAPEPHHIH